MIDGPGAERHDHQNGEGRGVNGPQDFVGLAQRVAADLAVSFAQADPSSRDLGWIAQTEAVRRVRPRSRRRSSLRPVAAGAALAVAGLIGGVLSGVYLSTHPSEAGRRPVYALQASVPQFHPQPEPRAEIQPQNLAPLAPPPAPAPQPAPVIAAPPPPIPAPRFEPKPAARTALSSPRASPPPRQPDTDQQARSLTAACDRGCSGSAVERADRLVADAYATAARSGAPASALADFRRRWDDLRHDADESPQILVGNYALLAHDLGQVARASKSPPRSRRRIAEEQR